MEYAEFVPLQTHGLDPSENKSTCYKDLLHKTGVVEATDLVFVSVFIPKPP